MFKKGIAIALLMTATFSASQALCDQAGINNFKNNLMAIKATKSDSYWSDLENDLQYYNIANTMNSINDAQMLLLSKYPEVSKAIGNEKVILLHLKREIQFLQDQLNMLFLKMSALHYRKK